MSTEKTQIAGYEHRVLESVLTRAYNTAASYRRRINETSASLVCKLTAVRMHHQWEENHGVGRKTMLDRLLCIRDCTNELLKLDTTHHSRESRALQAKGESLMQGPLRFISEGLDGGVLGFQEWEDDTLKLLDKLAAEAEELREYLAELAAQAQAVGVQITWWGDPLDNEAKVEHLEEGEVLEL